MTPCAEADVKPNLAEVASVYFGLDSPNANYPSSRHSQRHLSLSDPVHSRLTASGFTMSNMLWDQTKNLPKELLKRVEDVYRDHFPMEVRLHLASWIEEKFSPALPFNVEDPAQQKTAANVANQLLSQLDARIAQMPDDPEKFLMKGKLAEIAESLRVSPPQFNALVPSPRRPRPRSLDI